MSRMSKKSTTSKNAPNFDTEEDIHPTWKLVNVLDGPRNLMRRMYKWVIGWSEKPSAEKALAGLSFAESSFFPIPPDPLVIAMVTARPNKWVRIATITTVSSVLGGMFGYFIGHLAIQAILPIIERAGYMHSYETAVNWFDNWGVWAVLLAGFTPIPYKIFTIAAGAANMFFPFFLVGSVIGRGGRFFLVAFLMHHFGRKYKDQIEKYIDVLGLIFIVLVVVGIYLLKFL